MEPSCLTHDDGCTRHFLRKAPEIYFKGTIQALLLTSSNVGLQQWVCTRAEL